MDTGMRILTVLLRQIFFIDLMPFRRKSTALSCTGDEISVHCSPTSHNDPWFDFSPKI